METISGILIENYDRFIRALKARIDYFYTYDCKLSDHDLNNFILSII
ncbi:MAG: hypothetical protein GVY05_03590 [Bacteroidetes bacterium]|nr:hypothetical protein [Bacteroidota bacterium]